jgi:uncharacterized protein YijF (DUF1287 family)
MSRALLVLCLWLVCAAPAAAAALDPHRLVAAAEAQVGKTTSYDPSYRVLGYPGGDVAPETGVCSDVIVRAYRTLGIDLQQRVHDDMKAHFSLYPATWGLKSPDANIDHRRVPNLQVFFRRHGEELPVSADPATYAPGDLVTWNLAASGKPVPHIGIVTFQRSGDGKRPLIVHNIGAGARIEDTLFAFRITGHYRYALAPP